MNILDLPDDIRHLIIKHIFDYAKVASGQGWIEWNVKKYNLCCDEAVVRQ